MDSIALRAFAILEHVTRAPVPQSLDDVTLALGLPRPTAYRILQMLHGSGLLMRDQGTKRYSAGPRLMAFAVDLWRSRALRAPWRRALEAAVAATGESCNLTVLQDDQVLYLDRVETSHPLRLHLETGTRVPLHCTASGKLFLSQMTPEQARERLGPEPYAAYAGSTITRFDALEPELQRVRQTLVGTHDNEYFADSVAMAVPVLDGAGKVFAAVAVHAPASRMTLQRMLADCTGPLREAARVIEATLGGGGEKAEAVAASPRGRRPRPTPTLTPRAAPSRTPAGSSPASPAHPSAPARGARRPR